ncbi:MAG: isochorismate synthase [Tannerellaceae bacterium]|nr:isochorismate synthase [Tannerellaceae bacterium]
MRNAPCNLDRLIGENQSFAIYRLPGSPVVRFVPQRANTSPSLLYRMEDLNEESGFVIAPFEISALCPIVLIRPGREMILPAPEGKDLFPHIGKRPPSAGADAAYESRFNAFIAPIREKRFRKLVLSRSLDIDREEGFSPEEAFFRACTNYTRSYVYLFHTPATGTWLGCTPEILLSGGNDRWKAVALAGTQALCGEALPETWDDKNLIEQMLVAHYIREQLASCGIRPEENGPYTVRAGYLAHLRTDFYFSLPDIRRIGLLLKLLHPTPAVLGLPKEEARRFIPAHEGYDRRYYSGFAGWLDPKGETDLYVNLRCMQIHPQAFTLYAGGGLLLSSRLEDEWRETEDKLLTMRLLTRQ